MKALILLLVHICQTRCCLIFQKTLTLLSNKMLKALVDWFADRWQNCKIIRQFDACLHVLSPSSFSCHQVFVILLHFTLSLLAPQSGLLAD